MTRSLAFLIRPSPYSDVRFDKAVRGFASFLGTTSRVRLFVLHNGKPPKITIPYITYNSIPTRPVQVPRTIYLIYWSFFIYLSILRICLRHKAIPTIIHSCDFESTFFLLPIVVLLRISLVYDIYDEVSLKIKSYPLSRLLTFADYVVCSFSKIIIRVHTNRMLHFKSFPSERTLIIQNSPTQSVVKAYQEASQSYPPLPSSDEFSHTFLISGYLHPDRGLTSIIQAAQAFPNFAFIFLGKLSDQYYLRSISLMNNAFYLGVLSQIDALCIAKLCHGIFALYDPTIPINRLAVPNKAWDSQITGTPLIVNKEATSSFNSIQYNNSIFVPYNFVKDDWFVALSRTATHPAPKESNIELPPDPLDSYQQLYKSLLG